MQYVISMVAGIGLNPILHVRLQSDHLLKFTRKSLNCCVRRAQMLSDLNTFMSFDAPHVTRVHGACML